MNAVERWALLPAKEFAHLGMADFAYIKPVMVEGQRAFAIHAADGSAMAVVSDHAVALAAVRQHDLEPMSVH